MKKTYIIPTTSVMTLNVERMIAVSGDLTGGGTGTVTGTVSDTEVGAGTFADVKGGYNVWDDDWSK